MASEVQSKLSTASEALVNKGEQMASKVQSTLAPVPPPKSGFDWEALLMDVASVAVSNLIFWVGMKYVLKGLMPSITGSEPSEHTKKKSIQNLVARLQMRQANGGQGLPDSFEINEYEAVIADDVLNPLEMDVSLEDIGGLDEVKSAVYESIILPIRRPRLFRNVNSLGSPRGVLLYGPPGTGKTMMAKAIAREADAAFINLKVSTIGSKWYGETGKYVDAVFSLAQKISPCIIFIDEIDSFLRERSSTDHEATANAKTQFMCLWDGITTSAQSQVVVLGATNRPMDVDKAILRRLPRMFNVGLPNDVSRRDILRVTLKGVKTGPIDFDRLCRRMDGFSGSDIKEACREASMVPIREYIQKEREVMTERMFKDAMGEAEGRVDDEADDDLEKLLPTDPRPLETDDIMRGCEVVRPAAGHGGVAQESSSEDRRGLDPQAMEQMARLIMTFMNSASAGGRGQDDS